MTMFQSRRHARISVLCWSIGWLCHSSVLAVSLQDLLDGDSLIVADCRFDNWQLMTLDATSGEVPQLSQITVAPLATDAAMPGFQMLSNGQFAITGFDAIDVVLQFDISPLAGGNLFTGQMLALAGSTFGGDSGVALVSQDIAKHDATAVSSAVVIVDNAANVLRLADNKSHSPQSSLTVNLNVFMQGWAAGDVITLSSFTARFLQTGPEVLAGDYSNDGEVGLADYVVWRDHLNATAAAIPNQVDGGSIGPAHYSTWKSNFGGQDAAALPHGSRSSPSTAVPESVPTLVAAVLLVASRRFFRRLSR
jgi:hypothetical protein